MDKELRDSRLLVLSGCGRFSLAINLHISVHVFCETSYLRSIIEDFSWLWLPTNVSPRLRLRQVCVTFTYKLLKDRWQKNVPSRVNSLPCLGSRNLGHTVFHI